LLGEREWMRRSRVWEEPVCSQGHISTWQADYKKSTFQSITDFQGGYFESKSESRDDCFAACIANARIPFMIQSQTTRHHQSLPLKEDEMAPLPSIPPCFFYLQGANRVDAEGKISFRIFHWRSHERVCCEYMLGFTLPISPSPRSVCPAAPSPTPLLHSVFNFRTEEKFDTSDGRANSGFDDGPSGFASKEVVPCIRCGFLDSVHKPDIWKTTRRPLRSNSSWPCRLVRGGRIELSRNII